MVSDFDCDYESCDRCQDLLDATAELIEANLDRKQQIDAWIRGNASRCGSRIAWSIDDVEPAGFGSELEKLLDLISPDWRELV